MDVNGKVTKKEIQSTLKVALNKFSKQNFHSRLGTVDYTKDNISKLKNQSKNVKWNANTSG
jgi:hypothetical protein